MAVHSKNETLMCKVIPSSLGPVSFIDSFKELTRVFGSHFIMCRRVPRPLDSLLSMSIQEGETLKISRTDTGRYLTRLMEILRRSYKDL